jgi:hypothetical protein
LHLLDCIFASLQCTRSHTVKYIKTAKFVLLGNSPAPTLFFDGQFFIISNNQELEQQPKYFRMTISSAFHKKIKQEVPCD